MSSLVRAFDYRSEVLGSNPPLYVALDESIYWMNTLLLWLLWHQHVGSHQWRHPLVRDQYEGIARSTSSTCLTIGCDVSSMQTVDVLILQCGWLTAHSMLCCGQELITPLCVLAVSMAAIKLAWLLWHNIHLSFKGPFKYSQDMTWCLQFLENSEWTGYNGSQRSETEWKDAPLLMYIFKLTYRVLFVLPFVTSLSVTQHLKTCSVLYCQSPLHCL